MKQILHLAALAAIKVKASSNNITKKAEGKHVMSISNAISNKLNSGFLPA